MAIARRRLATIAPPASAPASGFPPGLPPGQQMPAPTLDPLPPPDRPAPDGSAAPAGHLRRCTFRRIDRFEAASGRGRSTTYEVMCLYVDADEPLPLGDIDDARPICAGCQATGIFRPDED